MNIKQETISTLKIAVISSFVFFALYAVEAYAWTRPPSNPPGGNVAGPLTTGSGSQHKAGGNISLGAGGSLFAGGSVNANSMLTNNFRLPTGAAPGRVLTSDASGNASWGTASGGGSFRTTIVQASVTDWRWSSATVACPAGNIITGGGGSCIHSRGWSFVIESVPTGNSWRVSCDRQRDGHVTATVFAVCARVN